MEQNPYQAPHERTVATRGVRLTAIAVVALLVVLAAVYVGLEYAARLIRGF
jgi:hypothetical protein